VKAISNQKTIPGNFFAIRGENVLVVFPLSIQ